MTFEINKLKCLENYVDGTTSLLLNFFGTALNQENLTEYLKDKKNTMAATVSLISVAMLGIKEELVEMQSDMSFESKLFMNSLENTVSVIAVKKDDGYYIDNYRFANSAELVNILRNKLAHGNFYIDFDSNRVVLLHEGVEIRLNIDKLRSFIIVAYSKMFDEVKTNKYEKNFSVFHKANTNRTKQITTNSELKDIIRNIRYYSFELTTTNETIPKYLINEFNKFIKFYKKNIDCDKTYLYETFKNMKELFNKYGCELKINSKKIVTPDIEEKLINYAKDFLIHNPNLSYVDQLNTLGDEAMKLVNSEYNTFVPISNNITLLILVDIFKKAGSVREKDVTRYMKEHGYNQIRVTYNTYGTIMINTFNTLFMYGYDDILTSSGGYKLDRSDEFDFSLLNFDNINPSIDGIDYNPLEFARDEYKKIKHRMSDLKKNIIKKQIQLNKTNKKEAQDKINSLIEELENDLEIVEEEYNKKEEIYLKIDEDYKLNYNYFKNRAIVNGIRNSIAHGNYEVISGDSVGNTKIIFTDLYLGKVTFKVEITYNQFLKLFQYNFQIVLDYAKNLRKNKMLESVKDQLTLKKLNFKI